MTAVVNASFTALYRDSSKLKYMIILTDLYKLLDDNWDAYFNWIWSSAVAKSQKLQFFDKGKLCDKIASKSSAVVL